MFGSKVVRITIYPAIYTECIIHPKQTECYLITALAGILFPLIISVCIYAYNKRLFLVALCLRVMSAGYAVEELFSAVRCCAGSMTEISDLSGLYYVLSWDPIISLMLSILILILVIVLLISIKPFKNIMYLENGVIYGNY